MATIWLTADEHYGHANIISYSKRPFESVEDMDKELIRRHNAVVGVDDTVIHIGDFTLRKSGNSALRYIEQLSGKSHLFVPGSHDKWIRDLTAGSVVAIEHEGRYIEFLPMLSTQHLQGYDIVLCHYALRTWPRGHYGTLHAYGHSHGRLPPMGRSMDVGVDNCDFYPISVETFAELMKSKPTYSHKE